LKFRFLFLQTGCFLGQQFIVLALLYDITVVHDQDPIGIPDRVIKITTYQIIMPSDRMA